MRNEEKNDTIRAFNLTGGRFLISSPSSIRTFTNEVAIAEDPSAMVLPELEEELGAE